MKQTPPYSDFFWIATSFDAFAFQTRFAEAASPPTIVEVPTGLGKTETTILPFIYAVATGTNRFRRLVYVLPMRALVEQTQRRVQTWVERLRSAGIETLPEVALLLGGDVDDRWLGEPERPYILIGTQDMILSRALNRGYAASPFLWPMAFGLLNNDAHWILDEVQLQGVGTRTAAQLQGLRARLGTCGVTATTFVSATIERAWVETVDHAIGDDRVFVLSEVDRAEPIIARRVDASKRVSRLDIEGGSDDPSALARVVAESHLLGRSPSS